MNKMEERVGVRVSPEEKQRIEEKVTKGEYETISEFLRVAIEKLLAA